jgi:hypothetical protein
MKTNSMQSLICHIRSYASFEHNDERLFPSLCFPHLTPTQFDQPQYNHAPPSIFPTESRQAYLSKRACATDFLINILERSHAQLFHSLSSSDRIHHFVGLLQKLCREQ